MDGNPVADPARQADTERPTEEPQPLYGCQASKHCPEDNGARTADELRVWLGKTVCVHCFENGFPEVDDDVDVSGLLWGELPKFVPAHERRIERLRWVLEHIAPYAKYSGDLGRYASIVQDALAENAALQQRIERLMKHWVSTDALLAQAYGRQRDGAPNPEFEAAITANYEASYEFLPDRGRPHVSVEEDEILF